MPCYDERSEIETRLEAEQAFKNEAVLCGILQAMSDAEKFGGEPIYTVDELLDRINWKEAGISRKSLIEWWEQHKADDRRRRASEEESKAEDRERERAYQKLTDRERKLLGIK